MASAHDVAAYILSQQAPMSTWKLQKLVYYSQAWHLAWEDGPIFSEQIQAWANGPVVYELFDKHRGQFSVAEWPWGNADNLGANERDTIDAVLKGYGNMDGRQLSHLTHAEAPWREARVGLDPTDRSNTPISLPSMQAFYSALDAAEDARPAEEITWADQTF
jgi:uncharacterized phage-associated protein